MALISCPNCGKPISPNATSCPHCGASLSPAEKEVKCPECGISFPATAETCPNCGEPNKSAQLMPLAENTKLFSTLLFIPAVFAALGVLIGLLGILSPYSSGYYVNLYKDSIAVPFAIFFLYNILFSAKGSKLFILSLVGAGLAATGIMCLYLDFDYYTKLIFVDLFFAGMAVIMLLMPLVGKAKTVATICSAVLLGGWSLGLILHLSNVMGNSILYTFLLAPVTLALFLFLFLISRKTRII